MCIYVHPYIHIHVYTCLVNTHTSYTHSYVHIHIRKHLRIHLQGSTWVIDPEFAFYGPMGFDIGELRVGRVWRVECLAVCIRIIYI